MRAQAADDRVLVVLARVPRWVVELQLGAEATEEPGPPGGVAAEPADRFSIRTLC